MTNEPSPRPWHFNGMRPTIYSDEKLPDGSARVVLDVETDHLPLLPCDENDRQLIADLALIVAAVNERDRLRDLVKRMIPFVEKCHSDALGLSKTIKGVCALKGVDTSEIDRINSEHDALIAEARAAIGEDAP